MSSHDADRTRLWSFFSLFLGKANLCSGPQPRKGIIENAVTVEVDRPAIRGFNETVAFLWKDARDFGVRRRRMALGIAAKCVCIIFQLSAHRLKRVPHRYEQIFACMVFVRFPINDQLASGDSQAGRIRLASRAELPRLHAAREML